MLPEALPVFPPDVQPSGSYGEALAGLVDWQRLKSRNYGEEQARKADWVGVHPHVMEFHRVLKKRCERLGIPMYAHEAMRSIDRQRDLYAQGVTKAKGRDGPHTQGFAFDFVHSAKGWNLDKRQWSLIGHIGSELSISAGIPMVWGGDFKSIYDPAHWELKDWRLLVK